MEIYASQVIIILIIDSLAIQRNFLSGDKIEIYDLNGNQIVYEIYDKYKISDTDLSCLEQDFYNLKTVTLITCDDIDNHKRLVVKAKEK